MRGINFSRNWNKIPSIVMSGGLVLLLMLFLSNSFTTLNAQNAQLQTKDGVSVTYPEVVLADVDQALRLEIQVLNQKKEGLQDYEANSYITLASGYEAVRADLETVALKSLISRAFSNVLSATPDLSPKQVNEAKGIIASMDAWELSGGDISDFEDTLMAIREFINQ